MELNSSVVDGDSLKEEIFGELKEELESGICPELTAIWTELWEESEQIKRKSILAKECRKEIREFLEEVLKGEKKVRDDYINRIEELLSEMNTLQKTLEIAIPYEDVETLPLHIMAARLNKKAEKYRVLKNELVQKETKLLEKELALCEKLGMVQHEIKPDEMTIKARLRLLENHISVMEQEKMKRTVTFLEQRQAIISLYEQLGSQPLLNFEKKLVSEDAVENFVLTNENMQELDKLRNELENQLENAKETVEELKGKLSLLWKYLGEHEESKEKFISMLSGCTIETIDELKKEVARCEAKKKENISSIVERIRQVLVEEWDRCLIGKEEREHFRPFNINCFTEDLCDLHELEIKRLKDYYKENEQVFLLLQKHSKLFNKLVELENSSKDANRYYNRGGQLLQEEKERRLIKKELPLVEEELRNLLKAYKEKKGESFTSFGTPVEDILDEQWTAHFGQKTIDKFSKKKSGQIRTPLGKRTCTTPCTPASATKISRLNPTKVISATKSATPKTSARGVTLRKKKVNEDNDSNGKGNATLVLEPTYDDFQKELQSKVEHSIKMGMVRSTAINEETARVLRERNTPNKIRPLAPIKTTPTKMSTPLWSPSSGKTPKTVPRTRKQNPVRLAPARNRFPIII